MSKKKMKLILIIYSIIIQPIIKSKSINLLFLQLKILQKNIKDRVSYNNS